MSKLKNIILLSTKSSGSSSLQRFLHDRYELNLASVVPHHENETLFWAKAASALKYPQCPMHRSMVPFSKDRARYLLQKLLDENGISFTFDQWTEEEVFEAYFECVRKFGPCWFEKSPHHLFNQSNLDLIRSCMQYLQERVDFLLIGLIRNPIDTIYSAWDRWHYDCRSFEKEWRQSYENLLVFEKEHTGRVNIVRYEDVVNHPNLITNLMKAFELPERPQPVKGYQFHENSIQRWKKDYFFSHYLDEKTIELGLHLGYGRQEMTVERKNRFWPLIEFFHEFKYRTRKVLNDIKGSSYPY